MSVAASASGSRPADRQTSLLRTNGGLAGLALLLVALLSAFGDFFVVERLVHTDNALKTAANLAGSGTLFRFGVASLVAVVVLDVVVALALFRVFAPVDQTLSMLAAWFRVAYAGVFLVAIAQLLELPRLASPRLEASMLLSTAHAYHDIWSVGLILFAVHLVLIGVLLWRATFAPSWLGVVLVISGLGYAVDGFGTVLSAGYHAHVEAFTFVGEVILIFWLLARARRLAAEMDDQDEVRDRPPSGELPAPFTQAV